VIPVSGSRFNPYSEDNETHNYAEDTQMGFSGRSVRLNRSRPSPLPVDSREGFQIDPDQLF
ncbi:MAG: hypothetical protein JAZ17_07785, partial [Candidatus Thiodiazotropha endolucinida]|nr:hypothetical protein [Candidatus Thiodiazotropha endolucinida]